MKRWILVTTILLSGVLIWLEDLAANGLSTMPEERSLQGQTEPFVKFTRDKLTIWASDIPLASLLNIISIQSGLIVKSHTILDDEITVEIHQKSLSDTLRELLRYRSFVYSDSHNILWILPQRDGTLPQGVSFNNQIGIESGIPPYLEYSKAADILEKRLDWLESLAEEEPYTAISHLSLALSDSETEVKASAITTLAAIGSHEAIQALTIALSDPEPRIREQVIDALGEIGDESVLDLLEHALNDDTEFVREAAEEELILMLSRR
jgi:hypothetical protein